MTMEATVDIPAGEFKARCLKLMDQVARTGETITITKRGKPVAQLVPVAAARQSRRFGCLAGTVKINGDIVYFDGPEWEALTDEGPL